MATASVVPSGGTSLLLEREVQVAALRALVEAVRSGGGRFVVIEGTAGIGKTRLLAEGRAIAGSAGMRVLAARGGELEGEFAYGIVRQLFEPLLATAAPELRVELLSGPAALIAPLLGASQPAGSRDAAAEGDHRKVGNGTTTCALRFVSILKSHHPSNRSHQGHGKRRKASGRAPA